MERQFAGRSEVQVRTCEGTLVQRFGTDTDSYRISSITQRGELVVIRDRDTGPPQMQLADVSSASRKLIYTSAPDAAFEIAAPVQIQISSEAGTRSIPAYLWKSTTVANPRLVILLHGGPHLVEGPAWDPITLLLVKRGISVLKVNYVGSTGYGQSFEANNSLEECAADVISARDYAVRHLGTRSDSIILWGISYGAFVAVHVLTKDQAWGAVLLTSTATPIRQTQIGDLHIPLQAFHGEKDTIVPPEAAQSFLKETFGAGIFRKRTNGWHLLPKEGHNFSRPTSLAALVTALSSIINAKPKDGFRGSA